MTRRRCRTNQTRNQKTNQQPVAILLTHTHYDHIGAVEPLRAYYQISVYVSPLEQKWLGDPILNLSGLGRHDDIADIIVSPAEYEFEMKTYTLGNMSFRVVPTRGTPSEALALFLMILSFLATPYLEEVSVEPICIQGI